MPKFTYPIVIPANVIRLESEIPIRETDSDPIGSENLNRLLSGVSFSKRALKQQYFSHYDKYDLAIKGAVYEVKRTSPQVRPHLNKHFLQDKDKVDAHLIRKLDQVYLNIGMLNEILSTLVEQNFENRQSQTKPVTDERLATQTLVDAIPIRGLDQVKEKLRRRGVESVLNGTEWLKAKDVGERAAPEAGNKHSQVSRWHKAGKIFAIERAGVKYYPLYTFDFMGNPIPEVKDVLAIFKDHTPFRVASWFESTSSTLGGKRPREVLGTNPKAVVEAAKEQEAGPLHG